ncbi:hypothetical protein ScPMuIL_009715 [Solemya velum]
MAQYMSRFVPDLAETLDPIRALTRKGTPWNWSTECEEAFKILKQKLTTTPCLAYFDQNKEVVLQVDSSKSGIGVVLLQEGRPVEYASRALTKSERKWAQIEKEALSVLYGLERFDQYTYERNVKVQNDHKPLAAILKKPLGMAPKRLQDIMMRFYRYDVDFEFVKGEKDPLSFSTMSGCGESKNEYDSEAHNEGCEDTSQTDSAVEDIMDTEQSLPHPSLESDIKNSSTCTGKTREFSLDRLPNDQEQIATSRSSSVTSSERESIGKYSSTSENSNRQGLRSLHSHEMASPVPHDHDKKFPYRHGMTWKTGAKLEAMDFMKKWYPAKIVDVDDEECDVLIHFEGWNQRYDEWVSMTSERLRPLTRHSGRKEKRRKTSLNGHRVGEKVLAKWTDCKMYPAKITAILSDGSYEVVFYDGFKRIVQPISLRPLPDDMKQSGQRFEISPPDSKDTKKVDAKCKQSPDAKSPPPFSSPSSGKPHFEQSSHQGKLVKNKAKTPPPLSPPSSGKPHFERSRHPGKFVRNKVIRKLKMRDQGDSVRVRKKDKVASQLEKQKSPMIPRKKKLIVAGSFFVKRAKECRTQTDKPSKLHVKKEKVEKLENKRVTPAPEKKTPTKLTQLPPSNSAGSQTTISVSSQTPLNVPSSPADSSASEKKTKKRTGSPAISDTSMESFTDQTPEGGPRRRSRSVDKDKPQAAVALKAFVIKSDHNTFKCNHEGCGKSFRKESLLTYHVKYYHTGGQHTSPNPPPRKRRKTTSICSTDSEHSITLKPKIVGSVGKRRHVSADVLLGQEKELPVETITPGNLFSLLFSHVLTVSMMGSFQDTLVTEESIGNETEEEIGKQEVVNCVCNEDEENGLMIQCEICLCWQHAACFKIKNEKLPKKYICFVCENPSGEFIDTESDEYKLWRKNWDVEEMEEKPNVEESESLDSTIPVETDTMPVNGSATNTVSQDVLNTDSTLDSLVIPMESEVVVSCSDNITTPEKDYTKGICLSDDNRGVSPTRPSSNFESVPTPAVATGPMINLTNNLKKCESASTITSESTIPSNEAISVPDHPLDMENKQDTPAATFSLEECSRKEEVRANAVEEKLNGLYVDCEQNLLKHILHIQNEIIQRLDLVEEQVSNIENADVSNPPLHNMPVLKRSLRSIQMDLVKVKRMAAFRS